MSWVRGSVTGADKLLPYVLLGTLACSEQPPTAPPPVEQSASPGKVVKASREIMSTVFEVGVVVGPSTAPAAVLPDLEAALDEVARIERVMSPYLPDSELSRVNAAAGGEPVPVSAELLALVERSVGLCRATDGLMDITFLPLGRTWDFRAEPFVPPTDEAIEEALSLVDCKAVEIDAEAGTLRLPRAGMGLGLGAVAKGYAVDRAAALLMEAGHADHLVNGGGDVLARGAKADGPWIVGIRHPRGAAGDLMGRMPLRDAAMVTSGDYERFVEHEGVRYHHIIDPRTGRPAQGIVSVSVVDGSAERADAIATALLVAGPEDAAALREVLGVEAIWVKNDGSYEVSAGLAARAELEGRQP